MEKKPLVLEKKIEELLNKELYPTLKKMPKAEKFALCQEIKQSCYAMLKCIVLANNVKQMRRHYQNEADGHQKLLLILISVAYEQQYINMKRKAFLQEKLYEIGRLIGGWMKVT